MGRPNAVVVVSEAEAEQLGAIARSRSLPHSLVRRARIVLMSAEGVPNQTIAERCGVSVPTISNWRRRWRERGVAGLHGELRPGRPRSYDDEQVAALINRVLHSRPTAATHWSVRRVAKETGISKSTVARYFALFALQPHRSKSFKLSTDPFFVEKVRDVVGLYLNPPDKALVLCVDEKSQVQALERTQPVLPMGLGLRRRGDPRLLSARHHHPVCSAQRARWRRHLSVQAAPSAPGIPVVPQPSRPQSSARAGSAPDRRQLRHPQAPAGQSLVCAPSALSHPLHAHLCQLAQPGRALVRARHPAGDSPRLVPLVRELVQKIDAYVTHYNTHKRPFVWTATADSILDKLQRLCKVINGTQC